MRLLGWIIRVLGILLFAAGLLWTLQGLGIVMWPQESFMLADRSWAVRGAITAAIGLVLIWLAGRVARR
ncbi:conserved hypothetical protein [Altererythrobacter sp. B11]|uniref:hypothetical protein n=1 Tax=Altererythrobacter sp. B11 TaxID=2060312 RepID=UPI000DC6E137|nr:hypothetical protein [Altererythrobacter sp. B11]BBC73028.1 conserved hypothetical protein [Altererythrobacter sp. B11]